MEAKGTERMKKGYKRRDAVPTWLWKAKRRKSQRGRRCPGEGAATNIRGTPQGRKRLVEMTMGFIFQVKFEKPF